MLFVASSWLIQEKNLFNKKSGKFYGKILEEVCELVPVKDPFWPLECYVVTRPYDNFKVVAFRDLTIKFENTFQSILG